MKKILLACNGGFSTSILVHKMKESAKQKKIEVMIKAIPENDIEDYTDWDILLLGPQIGHQLEDFQEEFDMLVYVIDSLDYGTMNGENVLNFVLDKIKHKEEE